MHKMKIYVILFIFMALVQLYVPAKMIFDSEAVLSTGKEFKFKTAPIDPEDPFRGKYITLSYEDNFIQVQNDKDWIRNELVYISLLTDRNGYAKIQSVSKTKPKENPDFVKAKVSHVDINNNNKLIVDYPYDRFYMEESKAPIAEEVYLESLRDSTQVAYALVHIKDGEAVIKDVMINGRSIREAVQNRNRK